jgi:hypothetical protein
MKTDRELLEQALKLVAKYHARKTVLVDWEKSVIEAISARLAGVDEDDEEPYAWVAIHDHHGFDALYFDRQEAVDDGHSFVWPLYRHPQTKARLTDEDIRPLLHMIWNDYESTQQSTTEVVRAIERKIWEKNS